MSTMALAVALGSSPQANAAFTMRLTQGANVVTIVDGGAGDSNPLAGVITFNGGVGIFNLNVTTGLSKPFFPTGPDAKMDLNSVNANSAGAGSLVIELSDTDWPAAGAGVLTGRVGGTVGQVVGNSATFAGYKNLSNQLFDITNPVADIAAGPFGPGAFSAEVSDIHGPLNSDYSMTLVATLVHAGASNTSFNFELTNSVPEPATIAAFAAGLPFIGGYFWRRRSQVLPA